MTAAYIQKRYPNKHFGKTAYKMFNALKPNLSKMHSFGSIYYV